MQSCGLNAMKSAFFAFFNVFASLSHFEQGKKIKTSELWSFAAFVHSDCAIDIMDF